jgi:hypothetical protein
MKYIFLTYDGHGLPVAYKLLLEGNDVIVGQAKKLEYMPKEEEELTKRRLSLYDGMIEKIDADELIEKMRKENPEDWFVICDFSYVYPYAEKLKKMGFQRTYYQQGKTLSLRKTGIKQKNMFLGNTRSFLSKIYRNLIA